MALFFFVSRICESVSPNKYPVRKAKYATVGKKVLEFEKIRKSEKHMQQ